jgi:uncharacterized membrane protein SpoIIM required for sporulation
MASPSGTEVAFVGQRRHDWDTLDNIVRTAQRRGPRRLTSEQVAQLSPLYRDVCGDLSRAQAAGYGAPVLDYLQGLTAAAHTMLYDSHVYDGWFGGHTHGAPLQAALEAFPRAVRRHKTAMLIAFLLFFVPFLAGLFATLADPGFAVRVVPEGQLRSLLDAYKQGFAVQRGAGLDVAMAGFYIHNNVGIALRCFATGIALGLGSVFYLVENGLATGAVVGYVAAHGAGGNILTFIVGHSSLELGAIVLAGGAGLALGWSIVAPGDKTRVASLQEAAKSVVVVVFGAAVMLFLAAAVEGFWSGSSMPAIIKRLAGGLLFVIVSGYIVLAGRGSTAASALEREERNGPWT